MQMSENGIKTLLKPFEGCRLTAYRCPANKCTIGWGHTSEAGDPPVYDGMKITQAEADEILHKDLRKYEAAVTKLVQQPLTQNQYDVLVDFAYNAGVGNLQKSTLLKRVNAADFDAVPGELMKFTRCGGKVLPGLVKRRQAEIAWWNADQDQSQMKQEQRVQPDPVVQRSMVESKQGNAAIVTASLASIGAAKEVVAQAQEAANLADQVSTLLKNSNFLIMAIIVLLAGAIWYWRKQNMEKTGA